jgi:putative ATPase
MAKRPRARIPTDPTLFGPVPTPAQAENPPHTPPASPSSSPTAAVPADPTRPLADRMRPRSLEDLVGQNHLVGGDKLLRRALADGRVPSMILWGPPGSGKTTIAHIVAARSSSHAEGEPPTHFVPFSAVLGGLPELRTLLDQAGQRRVREGARTILFIDEIHRFNKSQQDAFLPHVENGTITLIGATTENPSFAVNAALLSRCKVFRLESLSDADLISLLRRALADPDNGLGHLEISATDTALTVMAATSGGDARRALSTLEWAAEYVRRNGRDEIHPEDVEATTERAPLLYDKAGEEHYNVVSAFIKSMRGSDPDAAIYWMMRMIEAGDDPLFVLRRMIIFASEDIGNADPRALLVVTAADQAFRRVGMPEGIYPIAHACLYLASAPKSNAVKCAWQAAAQAVRQHGSLPVPKKLRNAVTALMRAEGYGQGYAYAHDFEGHVVPGESYLPEELLGQRYYEPSPEGLEKAISDRLERIRNSSGKS